jgi:hypothetical protein
MSNIAKNSLLASITNEYLQSRDFNGLPVGPDTPQELVIELIGDGLISLNRGDRHPNPYIKSFAPEAITDQIQKIQEGGLDGCLYPEGPHLQAVVSPSKYAGRPFTYCLALGEPQLSFKTFDLIILEQYRNDPRYYFHLDDIHRMISIGDDFGDDGNDPVAERDQTLLQSFGFAYDENMNRAVAVFLRYLHDLTPEHQRLWEARLLTGGYRIHPDYWSSSMGNWPGKVSIFVAFIEEIRIINSMTRLMGREPLFKSEFNGESRPREFAFLLRPTQRSFNEFVLVLDKMLSDNIEVRFFGKDVDLEVDKERPDGKITVDRKGSLRVLDDWLSRMVKFPDPAPKDKMMATLRHIRKLRQQPAHSLKQDKFDQSIFRKQRELVLNAYQAIRTLRLILSNHPATTTLDIPDWLRKGDIRNF